MSFLHGTDDNDSDALQCLPSPLETSSAKYIGQIEKSKAKEVKRKPQSRREQFEKCDKRFRQDQDRGDGRFWWSASVGDVIPAAENCGRCIRATGSGQSSRSSDAYTSRSQILKSPRNEPRIDFDALERFEKGHGHFAGGLGSPVREVRRASKRQDVVTWTSQQALQASATVDSSEYQDPGNGFKLEDICCRGHEAIRRASTDVQADPYQIAPGLLEEERRTPSSEDRSAIGFSNSFPATDSATRASHRCGSTDSSVGGFTPRRRLFGMPGNRPRCRDGIDDGGSKEGIERQCTEAFQVRPFEASVAKQGSCWTSQTKRQEVDPWNVVEVSRWKDFLVGFEENEFQDSACLTNACESEVPCPCDLWCMDLTQQESYMCRDEMKKDGGLRVDQVSPSHVRQKVEKRVRFNDQVQFILPTSNVEMWEQDDTALVQAWPTIHGDFVDSIFARVGDVGSVQIVTWYIDQTGHGSDRNKQITLKKHQSQQWYDEVKRAWSGEGDISRAEVSIVNPSPSVMRGQAEVDCINVIVWTKVEDKVPILMDRLLDGVLIDRSCWLLRSNTVRDIFVHVGWGHFVEDPDHNCVLDDGGVWLTPDVPAEVYCGFFGSLCVSQQIFEDDNDMQENEVNSSSTTYQSGESDSHDDEWRCDDFTLLQFWNGLHVDWDTFQIQSDRNDNDLSSVTFTEGQFNVESFWKSVGTEPTVCSIGDIPIEARLLEQLQIEDDNDDEMLDDESSYDEDTPVSFSNWNDLAAQNDVEEGSFQDGVRLITFGLKGVACGRRDVITQSLRPIHLKRVIWNLWQDVASRFEDLEVHFVLPQPWDELQAPGAIILLIEVCQENPSQVPVLSLIWDVATQTLMMDPHAMLIPRRATKSEVLQRLPFGELCVPFGLRSCILTCGLHQFPFEGADTIIDIGKGFLCKNRIQSKSDDIVQAEKSVTNFERFAMSLINELPDGKPKILVCIHHLDGTNSKIEIACHEEFTKSSLSFLLVVSKKRYFGNRILKGWVVIPLIFPNVP